MVGPATLISEESEEITENSPERCSNESSSDYTKKSEPAMEIQTDMLSMVQETRPATQELENSDGIITETGDNHILLPFPASVQKEKDVDPIKDNTLQLSGDVREKMWDLIPCYQIHAMFILAQIKNGILLIDQHAAHERILFEQAMEKSEETRTTSQQLLFPIVLEFSPAEKEIIESGKEYFHRFGFEIEDFGGQAVSVSAIPAFIKDSMVASTIREIVRYLLEGRHPDEFNDPHRRFAAAFACGAAIKAGQKLTQEEMNALLNNLFSSGNPYTCPHGRPTLVRMSIEELSRRFLR
jgi:DNA mismatch repair protein MutL